MYTKLLPLVLCVFVSGTFGCRGSKSSEPPVHLNPNMDNQDKYKPYRASTFFKNKRAMQTPPEGTVPVGKLGADSPDWKVRVAGRKVKSAKQFHTGQVNGVYQNEVPYSLTKADLERGQDRYGIYCTPCHGIAGFGNGTVADRSRGKLKPTNFHDTPGECTPKSAVAAKLKNLEATAVIQAPTNPAEETAVEPSTAVPAAPAEQAPAWKSVAALGEEGFASLQALEKELADPYNGCAEGYVCVANANELSSDPTAQEGQCQRSIGYTYHVITNGIRSMKGYKHQLTEASDRWAVAAYVRALELSQASDRNRVVDTFSDRLVAPPTQSKMFQELDAGGAYTLSKAQKFLPQSKLNKRGEK